MNKEEKLTIELVTITGKSRRFLEDAKLLLKEKRLESASSRIYYSVFHIMQAALLTKELSFSKHSGTIGGFNRYFIKKGVFPKEFGRDIEKLFKDRQVSDYSFIYNIGEKEIKKNVKIAERIIHAVENYLNKASKGKYKK